MAQDLIKLGREDSVTKGDYGYYRVKYNLIDVNMKEIKLASPLKQQGQPGGGNMQDPAANQQSKQQDSMMSAMDDILSAGAEEKAWEQKQLDIRAIDPPSMQTRKRMDQALREEQKRLIDSGGGESLSSNFLDVYFIQIQEMQDELYEALQNKDKKAEKEVMMRLAMLDNVQSVVKDAKQEFYADHFEGESQLSKSVSQQQVSFATQMYCENKDLRIVFAAQGDIDAGTIDWYGDPVTLNSQYAIVYDFHENPVLIPITKGNKDMYIVDKMKALEYQDFRKQQFDVASDAKANNSEAKINTGTINYKIDSMFGQNDGTASKEQDELVLQFAWDEAILQDGSSFRRDLYTHPSIKTLNYGNLDLRIVDGNGQFLELGPGDKTHWSDNITEEDKLRLVDAIVNQDNEFFDIKLLRTLIKEYYTYKIENAWWKGMGFEEGKLQMIKMKAVELVTHRLKKARIEAIEKKEEQFLFDGTILQTGVNVKK